MSHPAQFRERRYTHDVRDPTGTTSLLFPKSHLLDLARNRAGIVVDALRIGDGGLTFGRVLSVGHELALEDPDCITLLLPTRGRIAMEAARTEFSFAGGALAMVEAEKRRTRVVPPKDGVFNATTLLVPRPMLAALDRDRPGAVRLGPDRQAWTMGSGFADMLSRLLPDLAEDVFRQPDRLLSPRACAEFVSLIEDLLVDAHCVAIVEPRPRGGLREFQRVSRACDIIHARSDDPLSITELAAELDVTPRSLQLSFQSVLGMSPRQYLQKVRLNRVRARLLAEGDGESVTTIALAYGFTHLGRFSQAYRRTFGELPSVTAAHRRDRTRFARRRRN